MRVVLVSVPVAGTAFGWLSRGLDGRRSRGNRRWCRHGRGRARCGGCGRDGGGRGRRRSRRRRVWRRGRLWRGLGPRSRPGRRRDPPLLCRNAREQRRRDDGRGRHGPGVPVRYSLRARTTRVRRGGCDHDDRRRNALGTRRERLGEGNPLGGQRIGPQSRRPEERRSCKKHRYKSAHAHRRIMPPFQDGVPAPCSPQSGEHCGGLVPGPRRASTGARNSDPRKQQEVRFLHPWCVSCAKPGLRGGRE
jgi:hypothetical protein